MLSLYSISPRPPAPTCVAVPAAEPAQDLGPPVAAQGCLSIDFYVAAQRTPVYFPAGETRTQLSLGVITAHLWDKLSLFTCMAL